jgi:tetratricopeptide (TPR) repeat protein
MTGLFNYYIEQYPENHPMIKPMMGFFQKGDKELGLKELDYATKKAVFTQGSAYTYITYLYTKFEANYEKGVFYSKKFYKMNPNNTLNKTNYLMALLFNKQYDEALALINSLKKEKNEFFLIAYHLYKGWYALEKEGDKKMALAQFEIVELMSQKNKSITLDFYALACYKKAQIYEELNLKDDAKTYYKLALNDSSFEEVKVAYKSFQQKR